jgi:hypothetical protein
MAETQQTPVKSVMSTDKEKKPEIEPVFDKSQYVLKTMLKPSNLPKYDKKDTMNVPVEEEKKKSNDTSSTEKSKDKSTLMSIFRLNL